MLVGVGWAQPWANGGPAMVQQWGSVDSGCAVAMPPAVMSPDQPPSIRFHQGDPLPPPALRRAEGPAEALSSPSEP